MRKAVMDVLVVGAGVVGLTTAQALHADGHHVTVLEAQPGPAEGTSQANGGFLSPAYSVPFATPDLPKQAWRSLFDAQSPMRFRPDGTLAQLQCLWALWMRCNASDAANARGRFVRLGRYSLSCLEDVVTATDVEFEHHQTGILQLVRQAGQQARAEQLAETFTAQGFPTGWLGRDEVLAMEPGLVRSKLPLAGALHVCSESSGDCEQSHHTGRPAHRRRNADCRPVAERAPRRLRIGLVLRLCPAARRSDAWTGDGCARRRLCVAALRPYLTPTLEDLHAYCPNRIAGRTACRSEASPRG